jgi:CheY-like chemotaxis protein
MRILIADDDPVGRTFLAHILRKWGHDVREVADGDAAWSVLEEENAPRLLILDWMMPGLSGVEICQRIREIPNQSYRYIILLTARRETMDIIRGLEAGADTYLTKPVGPPELRLRLKTAERLFAVEERLETRIHELQDRLEKLGFGVDWLADHTGPSESAPATGQDPLDIPPRILSGVLANLGVERSALAAVAGDEVLFHASSAIVLRRIETRLGLDMHMGRRAAETVYRAMVAEAPRSDRDLLDALAELLTMCQGALKAAWERYGFEPIAPVAPSADLASPEADQSGVVSFLVYDAIRFSFPQSPSPVVMTPVADLKPRDILADPIRDPDNDQIVFLNRGVALNDRYIERIMDLVSTGRLKAGSIPVIAAALP